MVSSGAEQLPQYANSAPGFLTEYWILLMIALGLICLRAYLRTCVTKNWGWDDTMIVIAWVCLLAGLVLAHILASLGLGQHLLLLHNPDEKMLQILRYNTFFQIVNVLCTLTTKYSISLFILRLRDTKMMRRVLIVLMVLMTLATLQVIIVLCLTCTPLRKLWNPTISGSCMPLATVYICSYVQSGFTIIVDLALTASPIVILWNVRIDTRKKILVCLLMSLGLVATISNALRNFFIKDLTNPDFTYTITPILVMAILELSSGVIAACIPACMPIFKLRAIRQDSKYQLPLQSEGGDSGKRLCRSTMQPRDEYGLHSDVGSYSSTLYDGWDMHSLSKPHVRGQRIADVTVT